MFKLKNMVPFTFSAPCGMENQYVIKWKLPRTAVSRFFIYGMGITKA